MRASSDRLSIGQAIGLGLLHGPAERLPISSSGHTTLVPWLLGSDYPRLDPALRKALEVALHTGAAVGLLLGLPADLRGVNPPLIALASVPAGVAGLALERRIEARLGTPATIATGLVAGGIALGLADRAAEARGAEEATYVDGLWLGIAQAVALVPGVSRNGATLAAARWRRFRRADAARLSRQLAWPVIVGATALKAWRLRQDELRAHGSELTAAALASSLSTLLAARFFVDAEGERPLLPYAVYRVALGTVALIRLSQHTADR